MPYRDESFVALVTMKGTLNAEIVTFRLYISFHSREFHGKPHVTIPAHAVNTHVIWLSQGLITSRDTSKPQLTHLTE